MSDPRFKKINELFINYSQGNFDYKVEISPKLDEIDAFISNINMLGEELKATTISKNYFNNIFNSVTDIVFIMQKNGELSDLNSAGLELFKYSLEKTGAVNLFHLFKNKNELIDFQNQLHKIDLVINMRVKLKDKNGKVFDCMISVNKIEGNVSEGMRYQGIIKDMTKEKEEENLVIRTIVNTQEKERERFAKDLHDGLGIPLSGIRYYIDTLKIRIADKKNIEILDRSAKAIDNVISELKNICYNIMPRTMDTLGLIGSVRELCGKIQKLSEIKFKIFVSKHFPVINRPLEIAIFRIVQEFINNTIKHGNAKHIRIKIKNERKKIIIILKDDGIGFNYNRLSKFEGMGLQNVRSRVSSHNGEVEIKSAVNKGTTYIITLPIQTQ